MSVLSSTQQPRISSFKRRAITLLTNALVLGLLTTAAAQPGQLKKPVVKEHADAVYDPTKIARGSHVDVELIVTVSSEGTVSGVQVARSGGDELDHAAITAIRKWTFQPAFKGNSPIESTIRVPFHFAGLPTEPAEPPSPKEPPVVTPNEPTHQATTSPSLTSVAASAEPSLVTIEGKPTPVSRGNSDIRLNRKTLTLAPHNSSAADLLNTAPGLYTAHPEGDATAQRVYLRGFDAEHGQDIEFRLGGVPLNLSSHIHGQGYADLNFIIPEVVRSIRVIEGVYDPRQGDYAVAGTVEYDLGVEERRSFMKAGIGSFGTTRAVAVFAPDKASEDTFGAASFRQSDGFGNGTRGGISGGMIGQYRFSLGADTTGLIHLSGYAARANLAGVLRRDDINAGRVGFYDSYADVSARNQSTGASRTQIAFSVARNHDDGQRTAGTIWLARSDFRTRTNFTGYTQRSQIDPTWVGRGDLIEQSNGDLGLGGQVSHRSRRADLLSWLRGQIELGAEVKNDHIDQAQSLLRAPQNETWDQRVDAKVQATDLGFWVDGQLNGGKWARLRGGLRSDLLFYDIDDKLGNFIPAVSKKTHLPGFRRTAAGVAVGPRVSLESSPLSWLRATLSYGQGFRSPQARQLEEGERAPFATVKSFEGGITLLQGDTQSLSVTAYQTNLSYDLAFDPAEGRLERIGPTTRRGLVGYWLASPAKWLTSSLSATWVQATLDSPPTPTPDDPTPAYVKGQTLPYVPPLVVRNDLGVAGCKGQLRGTDLCWKVGYGATFLSSRPLPYGENSPPVFLLDAQSSVRRDWLELSFEVMNLTGLKYAETEYNFVSNWSPNSIPSRVPARHITAGPPRAMMGYLTVYL